MSTKNKKYIGIIDNSIETDATTLVAAQKQTKKYLDENDVDGEEGIIYELVPVKKIIFNIKPEYTEVNLRKDN